ncbi:MAG: DUF2293 domain-containing protein [Saprospiraceae bacterium]
MKNDEIKIFISGRESICDECHENLGKGAWIYLAGDQGALCLSCADLDHLIFLPSGDATLTRRSKKYSTLWAVVLMWRRRRKRYERQGLLVEEEAVQKAEVECLGDSEIRARRRERAAVIRDELDKEYVKLFTVRIKELFSNIPKGRERVIAEHACQKYSGRVGRSASSKTFDKHAINLAVIAHIRHRETSYDKLLSNGYNKNDARNKVHQLVEEVLERWKS